MAYLGSIYGGFGPVRRPMSFSPFNPFRPAPRAVPYAVGPVAPRPTPAPRASVFVSSPAPRAVPYVAAPVPTPAPRASVFVSAPRPRRSLFGGLSADTLPAMTGFMGPIGGKWAVYRKFVPSGPGGFRAPASPFFYSAPAAPAPVSPVVTAPVPAPAPVVPVSAPLPVQVAAPTPGGALVPVSAPMTGGSSFSIPSAPYNTLAPSDLATQGDGTETKPASLMTGYSPFIIGGAALLALAMLTKKRKA